MASARTFSRLNCGKRGQGLQELLRSIGINSTAYLATQSNLKTQNADVDLQNARPFADIPGPTRFQFVRGVLPGGQFHKKSVSELINTLRDQHGPLIRLPGMFGSPDTYVSLNPDDFPIIFRNEGQWPERRNFDSLLYYRQVYRRDFFDGVEGIIVASGETWAKWRSAVNPILMQPKNVIAYLTAMSEVSDEFLTRIREIRDPLTHEMPDTFEDDLNCLTFESVAAVALNTQLGLIRKNHDTAESRTVVRSIRTLFDLAFQLDVLPSLWKIVKTPKFYKLMNTMDTLMEVCTKYIDESLKRIEDMPSDPNREKSVLEKLAKIDRKFAVVMALDMLFAGVDTTSSTLFGIFLCIAKNPEKQAKLLEELMVVLPRKDSHFTPETMRNLPYLRACIKEGIRMYPIIPGTMRKLPHDLVLSGYHMKKGAEVAIGANLLLRSEKYVPRAEEFLPERWLRREKSDDSLSGAITNPFMYVPFGFGPRSCAGKRIVEMEMEIAVARLVRNFNIEYNHPIDNPFRAYFINVPNIPLKFKFEERPE